MNICVIPAKKDSTRLPNKNMRLINGKPVLYYSVRQAKNSKLIDKIYVSTDSQEIAEYAKKMGVGAVMRGEELSGEADVVDVYIDVLKKIPSKKVKFILGLQPDHPDRKLKIDKALDYTISHNYDDLITVDRQGKKNGSMRILKVEAIMAGRIAKVGSLMDDCTNIHYEKDLRRAAKNMARY